MRTRSNRTVLADDRKTDIIVPKSSTYIPFFLLGLLCHQSINQRIYQHALTYEVASLYICQWPLTKRRGVACKRSENPTEHAQRSWTRRKSSLPNMAMSGQRCAT